MSLITQHGTDCKVDIHYRQKNEYLESTMQPPVFDIFIYWKLFEINNKKYCDSNATFTSNFMTKLATYNVRNERHTTAFYIHKDTSNVS